MHLLIQHLLGREGISAAVSEPEAQFEPCAIRGTTLWGVVKVTQILRSILCCAEHFPIYSVVANVDLVGLEGTVGSKMLLAVGGTFDISLAFLRTYFAK